MCSTHAEYSSLVSISYSELYWKIPNRKFTNLPKWNQRKGKQKTELFWGPGGPYPENVRTFLASRGCFLAFSDTIFDTFHLKMLNIRPYKNR